MIEERLSDLRSASRALQVLGGAVILCCSFLVMTDVVLRNIFNLSVLYSFELTTYAFGIAVAFGFAEGIFVKSHIRIDIFYQKFPLPFRSILDCLALLLLAALASGLAYLAVRVAVDSFKLGGRSASALAVPLAVPQAIWACGLVFFAATAAVISLRTLILVVAARWQAVQRIAGA